MQKKSRKVEDCHVQGSLIYILGGFPTFDDFIQIEILNSTRDSANLRPSPTFYFPTHPPPPRKFMQISFPLHSAMHGKKKKIERISKKKKIKEGYHEKMLQGLKIFSISQ